MHDGRDSRARNAEFGRHLIKGPSSFAIASYRQHVCCHQFCVGMRFPSESRRSQKSPVANRVLHILFSGSPVQILRRIVLLVAITMAGVGTVWSRTLKGLKYQHMHKSPAPWLSNRDCGIAFPIIERSQQLAFKNADPVPSFGIDRSINGANLTLIRSLISWMARDVFPFFHADIIQWMTH